MISSTGLSAPEPILTIFVTSRKWSETFTPVVSQDVRALSMTFLKFSQRSYPRTSCKSLAYQNSTPASGQTFAILSITYATGLSVLFSLANLQYHDSRMLQNKQLLFFNYPVIPDCCLYTIMNPFQPRFLIQ